MMIHKNKVHIILHYGPCSLLVNYMDPMLPWLLRMRLENARSLCGTVVRDPLIFNKGIYDTIYRDLRQCRYTLMDFLMVSRSWGAQHAQTMAFCRAANVLLMNALALLEQLEMGKVNWCLAEIEKSAMRLGGGGVFH